MSIDVAFSIMATISGRNVSFEETSSGNLFGGFSFDEKSQDGLTKTMSNVSMESQDREFKKPWTRDEAQEWYVEFSFLLLGPPPF